MARAMRTVRRKPVDAIEVYRLTDNLSGKPRCQVRSDIAAELVEQDLARWCKSGTAVQLTGTVAEPSGTESAITHSECAANAGAARKDSTIAAACCKVKAWLLVGADPAYGKPTRAPLPTEPGGIRTMSREELETLRSGTGPVFVGLGARPVDDVLRKNRTHVFDNDFVQQHYKEDESESCEETQERVYGVPIGCHEGDVSELEA